MGSLRLINAWDFPTYLIVGVAAVFLAEFYVQGGFGLAVMVRAGLKSIFVFAVGYLVFLPFHLNYETFFASLESTTDTTVLWRFLGISGLFVFIIGSFFVYESRDWLMSAWRGMRRRLASTVEAVSGDDEDSTVEGRARIDVGRVVLLVLGAVLGGLILTAIFSSEAVGSTIPFIAVLLALVMVVGLRWLGSSRADGPHLAFVAVVVGVPLMLAIGLDIFRVAGDVDRMNSVFKFYLQIWVMLALASAYLLWRLAHGRRIPLRGLAWWKKVWLVALAALIISAAVYPVLGTQDRLRVRLQRPGPASDLGRDGVC